MGGSVGSSVKGVADGSSAMAAVVKRGRAAAIFTLMAAGAAACLLAATLIIFEVTPADARLGFVQKIFYFHLPAAIYGYVGFTICFTAPFSEQVNGNEP